MYLQCSAFYLLFYHLNFSLNIKVTKVSPIKNTNFCHCLDGAIEHSEFSNFFFGNEKKIIFDALLGYLFTFCIHVCSAKHTCTVLYKFNYNNYLH